MNEVARNTLPSGSRHMKSNSSTDGFQNAALIKQMEATKDVIDAFKAQPPLEKIYAPIK